MRWWPRAFVIAALAACAHEAPRVVTRAEATSAPNVVEPPRVSQYVLADGVGSIKLEGPETVGAIVVGGVRLVQTGRVSRVAEQETAPPLTSVTKLLRSEGGGFLFQSKNALFVAETFDGPLRPLLSFASDIDSVSLGPTYVLVRLTEGERVAIDPRTGLRAQLSPPGVIDVGALDDGRAAALTTFGSVFVTSSGKTWTDVSSELPGRVSSIDELDGELWISAENGAARVDEGGGLAVFDQEPSRKPSASRDPRWRDSMTPLRKAIRSGALIDDTTAIVVSQGAVVRVDATSGAIVAYAPARLPTDAECEAVRTPDDVVFLCRRAGEWFVASHGLSEQTLTTEQSFAAAGNFTVADDGAIAFTGPCGGPASTDVVVCVRGPGGAWQEHVLGGQDGGDPPPSVDRWVPRLDGDAIGLVLGNAPALVDARTGVVTALKPDPWLETSTPTRRPSYGKRSYVVVDRTWTTTPTGVRGWTASGAAMDVGFDGTLVKSSYSYTTLWAGGPFGFATAGDSAFQSTDHGMHWTEVAAPPHSRGAPGNAPIDTCSAVGCDLRSVLRLGWEPLAPIEVAATTPISAPKVQLAPLPTITCTPTATQRLDVVARDGHEPTDLAMGALRTRADTDLNETVSYALRAPQNRNEYDSSDGMGDRPERLITTGYMTNPDDGALKATGPNPSILALRRAIGFVQAFDPSFTVRRTSVGMADYFAAARAIGFGGLIASLESDPLTTESGAPLLGPDPAAANDLVIGYTAANETGAFALVRSSGTKLVVQKDRGDTTSLLVSAAQVGDDVVLLQATDDGSEQVSRWTGSALANVFEVPAPPNVNLLPTNPDALAIGPHGEIGVLRTTSGGLPPAADDPALLYLPGSAAVPMAAWSTLTSAEDPACKADPGWRAIVASSKPWFRAATSDLELAPMQAFMRVKWSGTRVCLEAIEVRLAATTRTHAAAVPGSEASVSTPLSLGQMLTWKLVGSPAAPAGASRGGAGAGFASWQPMKCSL